MDGTRETRQTRDDDPESGPGHLTASAVDILVRTGRAVGVKSESGSGRMREMERWRENQLGYWLNMNLASLFLFFLFSFFTFTALREQFGRSAECGSQVRGGYP